MKAKRLGIPAILLLILGTGVVSWTQEGAQHHHNMMPDAGHVEGTYHGGIVTPPLQKPKFVLTDTSGLPFDFQAKTNGYLTLLFFGYTNCPDVCPMQMSILGSALKKLPNDLLGQIKVVFVTTDPARDSPKVLRTWLNAFSKDFVGLTGTKAEIRSAQIAANLPVSQSAPEYDHAAFVVVYSKDNLAHLIYPSGIDERAWLDDLPQLSKETWKSR